MASAASLLLPKTAPDGPESQSVYRVIYVVATHPQGWEEATAVCVTEVAKTITDLRIARVAEKDVAVYPDGTHCFRVKLAVSYRVDRRRLLPGGQVTTVRRYLVLANQTADGETLRGAIADRVAAGPAEFHLVMPVRLPSTKAAIMADPLSGFSFSVPLAEADDEFLVEAQQRLTETIEVFRQAGSARVTGEVTTADPLSAAMVVLDRGSFDEIIVSTLPHAVSRWLHLDLPSRLARQTGLPITHVEQPPN